MPSALISVDVEASGPCPGHGDLISFAAVLITPNLDYPHYYSGNMNPECKKYDQGAYDAIGMTREEHENANFPIELGIFRFVDWCASVKMATKAPRLIMVSDNPGFDYQWLNYELHNCVGQNPFGHTARRINDIWSGLKGRLYETQGWKKYRVAPHDHHPLNDALGNAEAFLKMWELYGDDKAQREIAKL